MTTNIELSDKLKIDTEFIGCYPRDNLPKIKSFPVALIVNTDVSNGSGEHWIAIYITKSKLGEYFDSYGLPPLTEEIIEFLDKNCFNGWYYNHTMIQSLESIKCGQFCVLFIFLKSIGVSMYNIIQLFSNNQFINDIIIENLYKELS